MFQPTRKRHERSARAGIRRSRPECRPPHRCGLPAIRGRLAGGAPAAFELMVLVATLAVSVRWPGSGVSALSTPAFGVVMPIPT
jgi:hypothetical protein